jgi:hypothetical protein
MPSRHGPRTENTVLLLRSADHIENKSHDSYIASPLARSLLLSNIRPIVACAYRGVLIEPLPGNALICHIMFKHICKYNYCVFRHYPAFCFYLKERFGDRFCLRPQAKLTRLGQIERASPPLWTLVGLYLRTETESNLVAQRIFQPRGKHK